MQRETKKFPSRSAGTAVTFKPVFNMRKALPLSIAALAVSLSTGCIFSKKAHRAKESSAISADVEESFRKRWVDKRSGELTAQGTAAETARTQAEAEFREKYAFTRAGQR